MPGNRPLVSPFKTLHSNLAGIRDGTAQRRSNYQKGAQAKRDALFNKARFGGAGAGATPAAAGRRSSVGSAKGKKVGCVVMSVELWMWSCGVMDRLIGALEFDRLGDLLHTHVRTVAGRQVSEQAAAVEAAAWRWAEEWGKNDDGSPQRQCVRWW